MQLRRLGAVPSNMIEFRLQPEDCVIFGNMLVRRGRRVFDTATGIRHLVGVYFEEQTVLST